LGLLTEQAIKLCRFDGAARHWRPGFSPLLAQHIAIFSPAAPSVVIVTVEHDQAQVVGPAVQRKPTIYQQQFERPLQSSSDSYQIKQTRAPPGNSAMRASIIC
jgi:hypothetical protein